MTRDAVDAARRVIGLYGDPTVSWSILLGARLFRPVNPVEVRTRLADATRRYPHLGEPPPVRVVESAGWPTVLSEFADRPYLDAEPLVRVAAGQDRLLIAAHHGAVDGLGLLALLGIVLAVPVSSNAQGIGALPAAHGFVTSSALRLLEALFAPPGRAVASQASSQQASSPDSNRPGDALAAVELPASRVGSAVLAAATGRAVATWNQRQGTTTPRIVAALGASRRSGTALAPDRCTGFYRLRMPAGANAAAVRRQLERTAPEPDFPSAGCTLARALIRALCNRLGATFLVSNLGVVDPGPGVRSLVFYPAASGGSGIAVGAVTCGETTTVTVRARRTSFDDAAASALLGLVVEGLPDQDR